MIKWEVIGANPNNLNELYYVGIVNSLSEKTKQAATDLAKLMCNQRDLVFSEIRLLDQLEQTIKKR